ncbi:unnamed protein product, partial [Ectocarpus sp. 8 AP-2014]
ELNRFLHGGKDDNLSWVCRQVSDEGDAPKRLASNTPVYAVVLLCTAAPHRCKICVERIVVCMC